MRRTLMAASLVLMMPVAGAWAEEPTAPETMAAEGISKLMKALELFVDSIPLYAAPEILPNGDIILRRIQPDDDASPTDGTPEGDTQT
ncbi:hypothetical protein HH303_00855 [Rhodospirillaceae bacterium KN72]|uniref:Uncharacterized protein n=1 Tax=Pacificispira spongiicola TaxID=2729598 RepID=A0A7Y0DY85_9PROT|nr:hypothetical protein [Pacificispira spongiicola]NMM43006.1 hypothetical protein [Pacificispira spongiicola]